MSISLNSFPKFETRVLPSILEYVKRKGEIPQKLAFSLAATIAFYRGKRGGETIALNDDAAIIELLNSVWRKYDGSDASVEAMVKEVLGYEKNWKLDLNTIPGLTASVTKHLIAIANHGVKKAIETV